MKAAPFTYHPCRTIDEAVAVLDRDPDGSKVIAGGQSLVPMLNLRLARVDNLVDLNRIEGLDYIRVESGKVIVGAATRQYAIERSPQVLQALPLLPAAMAHVGHAQIRNRGTVVGSICHADPSAELPAVWLAVGGELTAVSSAGARTLRSDDFFQSFFTTALQPNEIATQVTFNALTANMGWSFEESARRHGDFAIVGAITLVSFENSAVSSARIVVFGAAPTPVRIPAAEQLLTGRDASTVDDDLLGRVAQAVSGAVTPTTDIHGSAEYRRYVAGVLTRRGLTQALERAGAGSSR
jgi:carbon-monoxide dehydrogenase medium subunit